MTKKNKAARTKVQTPLPTPQPKPKSSPTLNRVAWAVLAVCMVLFTMKTVSSMVQESATWDETHYFGMGKYLIETGRWDVPGSILHPPLAFYISSIPLLFSPTNESLWQHDPARSTERLYRGTADVARGQALLASPENSGDRLLTSSRFMMVLVGLLLVVFVFKWALALYGPWGAMLATILYTFCPNILANTRLITPDIVVSAFSFVTLFFFWKLLNKGRTQDAVVGGIALGLALLSKFTGALLVPACIALAATWLFAKRKLPIRNCLIFGALGFFVLLLGYRFNLEPYFSGIAFQQQHADQGQWGYLLGDYRRGGWWYYYIVAFLLKTPIPAILLMVPALVVYFVKMRKSGWVNELFLLLPAAVVFGFFSLSPMSIGVRYILPVYPLLFVFAAGTVRLLPKKVPAALGALLVAWYLGASFIIHPHYLAYFNELAGGPNNGWKYLADSNLDWGQDLKGLGVYMREHGIPKVCFSYFGSDLPERYGIAYDWLPSLVLRNNAPGAGQVTLHDWVAISATNLAGVYFENHDTYAMLRTHKPVAKIGYSMFLYNLKQ